MDKKSAYLKALRNAENWMGGAVIVRIKEGFDAIPGAYLSDRSYTGSREVEDTIAFSGDFLGGGYQASDLTDEQLATAIEALLPSF